MDYSACYDPDTDFDRWYTAATGDAIAAFVRPGDRVLELGCATGAMSARFVAAGASVVGIDQSSTYLARATARGLTQAVFLAGDIEEAPRHAPDGAAFDHVVLANVLHELPDAGAVLDRARQAVGGGGLLHVSLQNPNSLHRLVAVEAGLLDDLKQLSARGEQYGTLRLYDAEELIELIAPHGWQVVHRDGLVLKPLPNAAMAELPDAVVLGFVRAARFVPQFAAITYLLFRAV